MNEILKAAKIIWSYHKVDDELSRSDLIFGLGSIDIRTADRSAEIFNDGLAPLIMFSGGIAHANDQLRTTWSKPEAEVFARRAISLGVPKDKIIIENRATNTGENIKFGYQLLIEKGLNIKSIILVQKPYMGKRTYATFLKQWPGENIKFYITSPKITFEEYMEDTQQAKIINIMVGDLDRIIKYPAMGFQIEMEVPNEVIEAFEFLKSKGYTQHLLA